MQDRSSGAAAQDLARNQMAIVVALMAPDWRAIQIPPRYKAMVGRLRMLKHRMKRVVHRGLLRNSGLSPMVTPGHRKAWHGKAVAALYSQRLTLAQYAV